MTLRQNQVLITFRSSRPELFYWKGKGVLKNVTKFKEKHLYRKPIFNKVARLRPATSLKNRPRHRFFLMNFVKFLRTTLFAEHERWLLLNFPFFYLCKNVGLNITTCLLFCLFRYQGLSGSKLFIKFIRMTIYWDLK